jgi:hypothetical protein
MEGAAMSGFVFTLRVKPPKPSTIRAGNDMIVIKSNVRIPVWVLDRIELTWPGILIERLRNNHVIIVHTIWWPAISGQLTDMLIHAPSNSRRHFPAQMILEERVTCKVLYRIGYPLYEQ